MPSTFTNLQAQNSAKSLYLDACTVDKRIIPKVSDLHRELVEQENLETISIQQFVAKVFGHTNIKEEHLLGLVLRLLSDELRFLGVQSINELGAVRFRRLKEFSTLRSLENSVQEAESKGMAPFSEFVGKCKSVLSKTASPVWSSSDWMILNALRSFSFAPQDGQAPFLCLSTYILGPLEYEGRSRNEAWQLLVDLGLYHRYDNLSLLRSQMEYEGFGISRADDNLQFAINQGRELLIDKKPVDGCEHLRHDFGDLPVYTIDDAGAREIDDGVSIEWDRTTGKVDWIHIHVADPTSLIPSNNFLVEWAIKRSQTLYFPEGSYSMLPVELGREAFSLGILNGKFQRVLSISVQLDEGGNIQNSLVRPGLVSNIQPISYSAADTVLDYSHILPTQIPVTPLIVDEDGALQENVKPPCPFPDSNIALQDLSALQRMAHKHASFRLSHGAFGVTNQMSTVSISPMGIRSTAWPALSANAPKQVIYSVRNTLQLSPSRLMVTELMILAGRAVALWGHEAGTPLPYRVQSPPSGGSLPIDLKAMQHKLSGDLNLINSLKLIPFLPSASYSAIPNSHFQMGIPDGYCKITSPLRRSLDLLSHLQIKATLRRESAPSFDKLYSAMAPAISKEQKLRRIQNERTLWWSLEAIRRRFQVCPTEEYVARALHTTHTGTMSVLLHDIGVIGYVPHAPVFKAPGTWGKVRIESVHPHSQKLDLKWISELPLDPQLD
jgi:hypothetical protein